MDETCIKVLASKLGLCSLEIQHTVLATANQEMLSKVLELLPGPLDSTYLMHILKNHFNFDNLSLIDSLTEHLTRSLLTGSKYFRYLYLPLFDEWLTLQASNKLVSSSSTAYFIWPASICFLDNFQHDLNLREKLKSYKSFLELGSGTGVLGLGLAMLCPDTHITLSDLPETVLKLEQNLQLNANNLFNEKRIIRTESLDWADSDLSLNYGAIVAADVVYDPVLSRLLVGLISRALYRDQVKEAFVCQQVRNPVTWASFIDLLKEARLKVKNLPLSRSRWFDYDLGSMQLVCIVKGLEIA